LSNDEALAFFIGIGLIGLLFGFFQSLVLRKKFIRAFWWIIPNIIGLYLAVAPWEWVYLYYGDYNWSQGPALAFYLLCYWWFLGLVLGIITAIGLVWILRGPVKDGMGTEAASV
jgi:hypothetical protein